MKLNALTRTAYSPIPTVAARADERRAAPSAPAGMQLDTYQQLEFVEMEPYVR